MAVRCAVGSCSDSNHCFISLLVLRCHYIPLCSTSIIRLDFTLSSRTVYHHHHHHHRRSPLPVLKLIAVKQLLFLLFLVVSRNSNCSSTSTPRPLPCDFTLRSRSPNRICPVIYPLCNAILRYRISGLRECSPSTRLSLVIRRTFAIIESGVRG